jgi:hypothetical protein
MSDEQEAEFQDRVVAYLQDQYGKDNVEESKYLPDPYRFCDIWVEGPLFDYAIEVENDFEAATAGVGQAVIYAAEEVNAVPVIVLPPDHSEEPEISSLRRAMPVVELDV